MHDIKILSPTRFNSTDYVTAAPSSTNPSYSFEKIRITKAQLLELVQRLIIQVKSEIDEMSNYAQAPTDFSPRKKSPRTMTPKRGTHQRMREVSEHSFRGNKPADELSWTQQLRKRV